MSASSEEEVEGVLSPEGSDLDTFRRTPEAKKLVKWVKTEFDKAKTARAAKVQQWFVNMSMFYGKQDVTTLGKDHVEELAYKLVRENPYRKDRKTINRVRSFVRNELSKFTSREPTATAVPASADDEDVRAAYAAEQVWQAISIEAGMRKEFTKAALWMILTGNGFLKQWWDQTVVDRASGQRGNVRIEAVTPFNIFVPDLREQEIQNQPFVINAYTKTIQWCKHYYADALDGISLTGSETSPNDILEESYVNLQTGGNGHDSVMVLEAWIKPGANDILPDGGLVILVDNHIVQIHPDGMPYDHLEFPFTKFEHIPTATFYADSPLNDIVALQKEYNELRTEISTAGKLMARPQLLAPRGSIIPSKLKNAPGLVIQYQPGLGAPQPLAMAPLPAYYVQQQDRVLTDIEDITGQHDVSRGQAPPGVTAGTAINYLQEKDDQYNTTQYRNIEDGYTNTARQATALFVQFADVKRKIKTVGTDGTFDAFMLSGADIAAGTDIRMEVGSAVGQSKAARDARVMEMVQMQIITPEQALKQLEVGGVPKYLDLLAIAEKKAQRENMRMKMLTEKDINAYMQEQIGALKQEVSQMLESGEASPQELQGIDLEGLIPPIIPVDDFDDHEAHLQVHRAYMMGQEYESLPDPVKKQFVRHLERHEQMMQEKMMQQMAAETPPEGNMGDFMGGNDEGEGGPLPMEGEMMPPGAEGEDPGAMMSGNGAVPDMSPEGME